MRRHDPVDQSIDCGNNRLRCQWRGVSTPAAPGKVKADVLGQAALQRTQHFQVAHGAGSEAVKNGVQSWPFIVQRNSWLKQTAHRFIKRKSFAAQPAGHLGQHYVDVTKMPFGENLQ